MNWDRMEGGWKQRRGKAVRHWGEVMNDDLAAIAGKYGELVGKLQERYGIASEDAHQRIKEVKTIVGQLKRSNRQLMQRLNALEEKQGIRRVRGGPRIRSTKAVRASSGG